MSEETMSVIREEIRKTIKETVNGKIDKINEIIEVHNTSHELDMIMVRKHIDEVKHHMEESNKTLAQAAPYLEGLQGAKVLGTGIKWFAGLAVAAIAIKTLFWGNP